MAMKLHELHPAMIHAPLALLPGAAAVDLIAAITCDRRLSRTGARLWELGAGAGLVAGLAGMAASQEVSTEEPQVSDAMYLHGIGNLGLVLAAAGMAIYRSRRPASIGTALLGLVASGSAIYTAYLGGELVYGSGLGVKAMSEKSRSGASPDVPEVLSAEAPSRFLRDAVKGLGWLLRGRTSSSPGKPRSTGARSPSASTPRTASTRASTSSRPTTPGPAPSRSPGPRWCPDGRRPHLSPGALSPRAAPGSGLTGGSHSSPGRSGRRGAPERRPPRQRSDGRPHLKRGRRWVPSRAGANRSPTFSSLPGMDLMVNAAGSSAGVTSLQRSGVETVARSVGRTE